MMSVSIYIRSVCRPRLQCDIHNRFNISEQRKSQNFVLVRLDCVKTCEVPFLLLYTCIFRVNVDFFHFLFSLFDVTGGCYWFLHPGWGECLGIRLKLRSGGVLCSSASYLFRLRNFAAGSRGILFDCISNYVLRTNTTLNRSCWFASFIVALIYLQWGAKIDLWRDFTRSYAHIFSVFAQAGSSSPLLKEPPSTTGSPRSKYVVYATAYLKPLILLLKEWKSRLLGVSNGLCEHFASMRAVRFFLRARAVINFLMRAASTS